MELSVWQPAPLLPLSSAEHVILEAVAASVEIPARVRKRAGIVLRAAGGVSNNLIAQDLSISRANVLHWRSRFLAQGIRGLWDVERVPPREPISEAVEQAVVSDCLYHPRLSTLIEDNDPSLRWTVRNLALRHNISRASVSRIFQKHGIQQA
jgi:Homeodomain-like domain